MMKKTSIYFLTFFLSLLCAGELSAQVMLDDEPQESSTKNLNSFILRRVAYINSNELLEMLPEKAKASEKIEDLNKKYKEELQSMQNDYNKKYSDFISYQNTMANNIRLRRMQELYELERHIKEFMELAQKDIESQEQDLIVPLRLRLRDAINQTGREQGLICIYDLANPSIAFVSPDAMDITPLVKKKLGLK